MNRTAMFLGMLAVGFANAQYDGRVGINTKTPSATLSVHSNPGTADSEKNLQLFKGDGTQLVTVLNSGKVGIGTATPSEALHIVGKAKIDGLTTNTGSSSDKIVVVDNTGVLKSVDRSTLGGGLSASSISGATNGLTKAGNNVKLGGNLTEATTISQVVTHNFTVSGGDNQPDTVRFITDTHTQHNKAVYVKLSDPITGTNGNLREHNGETAPTYQKNDYMIILTNNKVHGKLELPEASDHKGRIIYLINGTTQGLNFSGTAPDSKTPFNTSTLARGTSVGYISNGVTWYPLGR